MRTARVLEGLPALWAAAAELVARSAREAVGRRGRFAWALAGGRTPLGLYALMAGAEWDQALPWAATHLFWGDERCLPHDDPDSNFGAARAAWGRRWDDLAPCAHAIPGELGPDAGAARYGDELTGFFGPGGPPVFDLVLLGLGADGHLASLFPGDPACAMTAAWAAGVAPRPDASPPVARVTLTFPVLNAARRAMVLVSGARKAGAAAALLGPSREAPAEMPASRLASAEVVWLLDREAAGGLPRAYFISSG